MSIYKIIQELASTRSSNDKKAILTREKDNTELQTFFRLALSNQIMFYQKKVFDVEPRGNTPLLESMSWLENVIASRKITGNDARDKIEFLLEKSSVEDAEVLKLILQKKSGCDLGVSIINKIWPKLIPDYPCLLATNWETKLADKLDWKSGCYAQLKSDGLRVNIVVDEEGGVKCYTRAGNELNLHGVFDVVGNHVRGVMIDGELLTVNPSTGKYNPRQTSNGICSKAIHGTMSVLESSQLHLTAWDIVTIDDFREESSDAPYSKRFDALKSFIEVSDLSKLVSVIPSKMVYSIDEAQDLYQEMISQGEEGIIVKSPKMVWENKRSKLQLKVKAELTADLKVVGYLPGKGELTGNLGALLMESDDSLVEVSMSGFSLKHRSQIFANLTNDVVGYSMVIDDKLIPFFATPGQCDIVLGSIVEVKYNAKIKSKSTDTWSLFLPRFSKSRPDKTFANKLEEIK